MRDAKKDALTGGTPQENAADHIGYHFKWNRAEEPKRNAVCLNAGAAIYLAGKADSIEAGCKKSRTDH